MPGEGRRTETGDVGSVRVAEVLLPVSLPARLLTVPSTLRDGRSLGTSEGRIDSGESTEHLSG